MTPPTVRDLHVAQQAAIPASELTSPLTGLEDTAPTWPYNRWGGAHIHNRWDITPDDLDPLVEGNDVLL